MTVRELAEKAEEFGWKVDLESDCIEFQKYSTAGKDFIVTIPLEDVKTPKDLVNEIFNFYDAYDPSYEAYLCLDDFGHGVNGAPYEMGDVYKDAIECKSMVFDLCSQLKIYLKG